MEFFIAGVLILTPFWMGFVLHNIRKIRRAVERTAEQVEYQSRLAYERVLEP